MKLVLDTKRLRRLHTMRVTSWEMFVLLFLEEIIEENGEWTPLPITVLEKELGISRTEQTRLLHGLVRHRLIETRVKGTGKVRRQVRLIQKNTSN